MRPPEIDGEIFDHPLLGRAQRLGNTAVSAIDWDAPAEIPVIAAPGQLPLGLGSKLLNELAIAAQRAGISALRYAGPYPTPALFATLLRSFRTTATEAAFTTDLIDRAMRLARDPIAIDFAPAPHERREVAGGWLEVRDGIERAVLGGIAFEPSGSIARLLDDRAELWFGDQRYARVADLATGERWPIPAYDSPMIGKTFPPALREALAEIVSEVVPAPLAADARSRIASTEITWRDLGPRAARTVDNGLAVHAILWDRLSPHGMARVALALAEALAPVVTTMIVADLCNKVGT